MYNGWKNRATWNVALWIGNDYGLYKSAVDYVKQHPRQRALYKGFVEYMGMGQDKTPDNIKWLSNSLDYRRLNEMMKEL
jgi:hypothetical protein